MALIRYLTGRFRSLGFALARASACSLSHSLRELKITGPERGGGATAPRCAWFRQCRCSALFERP